MAGNATSVRKCIYCTNDVLPGGFNTEHVISRAFGTFENNLTLTDLVCRACNQFFGDNLERVFARDSFEALDRIKVGLKPVEEIGEMPQSRLTFTAAIGGEWDGLRLALIAEDGREAVTLVPQVGFPRQGGAGWTYLTDYELADPATRLPADWDRLGRIRIIGPTDETRQRLIGFLADRGVPFHQEGDFALPQLEASEIAIFVNMKIDPVVKRCIAKYAFNYMACVGGRDFALLPAFNVTRNYIRQGHSPSHQLVVADDLPILASETRSLRHVEGHLATLNWTADKRHIVSQITLFNRVRYRVSLASNYTGLWRPIRRGHFFDLSSRTISPLVATSLLVPRVRDLIR